jgi:hypothetical protein
MQNDKGEYIDAYIPRKWLVYQKNNRLNKLKICRLIFFFTINK